MNDIAKILGVVEPGVRTLVIEYLPNAPLRNSGEVPIYTDPDQKPGAEYGLYSTLFLETSEGRYHLVRQFTGGVWRCAHSAAVARNYVTHPLNQHKWYRGVEVILPDWVAPNEL